VYYYYSYYCVFMTDFRWEFRMQCVYNFLVHVGNKRNENSQLSRVLNITYSRVIESSFRM